MNNLPNKRESADKAKGFVHIFIGIVYVAIGSLVIYANKNKFIEIEPMFSYIMCGLFTVYGIFRIYRGYLRVKGKEMGW